MGIATAYLRVASTKLNDANAFVAQAGAMYSTNLNNKSKEINTLLGKAHEDNKTVYYEKEPGARELPPLDPKNFVKLTDVK